MADVITKAELARELDLSRARISQLCGMGLPVRPDGRVNRAEAVAWVKANVCSWRGGWWGNLRQKAGRGRAPIPAADLAGGMDLGNLPELGELPDTPDLIAEIGEAAVIDFMNEVRRTENVKTSARLALRFGCTMQQAFAVARCSICSWRSTSSRRTRSAITSGSMRNRTGTAWRRKRAPRRTWTRGKTG